MDMFQRNRPTLRNQANRSHQAARRLVAVLASTMLVAAGLAGCSAADDDGPEQVVDAFLSGWPTGEFGAIGFLNASGQRMPATEAAEELLSLAGELADTPPVAKRDGDVEGEGDIATARVTLDWTLPGGAHWVYPTTVRLRRGPDGGWQVVWEPAVVHEKLTAGDQLAVRRTAAPRGKILDRSGKPIVESRSVVQVGVQPSEVPDPASLVRQLESAFRAIRPAIDPPIDLSDLPDRMAEAKPDAFVDVVLLRREAYDQIRTRVYGLPGTRFREERRDLAPTREFARALLGSVDPVQKADLEADPGVYQVGDLIGHGGLQGRYERQLRGTVGSSVIVTRTTPAGVVEPTGTELFRQEPVAGASLRTTLDVATQNAADAALATTRKRSALVAVRISDGAVLAAGNGPDGGGENLAFTAQVPPGSTFKMVSALGLLDAGAVTLDGPVDCPKTFTVEGRSFKNSNDFALGRVPFRVDFARSCNTAFAALAPKLGPDGLAEAGRSLGLEGAWDLGAEAFTGKVSTGGGGAERAAAAFGQGTTVVSPLAMAGATAAVAGGQWQQPKLLLEPAPAGAASPGPRLRPGSVEALRTMMREVVTAGTARMLADVPGGPVHGKTGTAEYDDNPANTHAWFIGWQSDVAFAVFVEDGGGSGETAVPIAERFLRAVAI
jgi:cell division protein FtsI/penicillin-binding protein 2